MRRRLLHAFLALLVALGATALRGAEDQHGRSPATAPATKTVAQAANGFGFRLFRKLVTPEPGANVFVSPASIAMALTMTYNGAAGSTRDSMAKVLGLEKMSLDQVNQASTELRTALDNPESSVQLAIANSLWGRLVKPGSIWAQWGFKFRPDFLDLNRRYFAAKVSMLDFASPKAANIINNWVSQNTRGKIPKIVDAISPQDVLFLINAVYFKGGWSLKFDPKLTQDTDFNLTRKSTKKVRMMAQDGDYQYYEGEGFQAVRLPYGKERIGMYVFLPDSSSDLQRLYAKLDDSAWETWLGRLSPRPGHVELPKFRLKYDTELSAVLKEMGMAVAFDRGQADFSRMVEFGPQAGPDARAWIGEVRHKTFADVNEEGTEAAAVTEVRIIGGPTCPAPGSEPPMPFVMIVDRPFLCAIQDNETSALLFLGSIVNPE